LGVRRVRLIAYLHQVPKLRVNGVVSLFIMRLWCARVQLYFSHYH